LSGNIAAVYLYLLCYLRNTTKDNKGCAILKAANVCGKDNNKRSCCNSNNGRDVSSSNFSGSSNIPAATSPLELAKVAQTAMVIEITPPKWSGNLEMFN